VIIKRSVGDEENIKPKEETSLIVELDNKLNGWGSSTIRYKNRTRNGIIIENGTEGVCMPCAKKHEKITRIDKSD
jgi:hypothetical protein